MVVTVEEFCKKFESVDPETMVCLIISNNNYEIQTRCYKQYIEFWPIIFEKGIRFFIGGTEFDTQGTIYNVEKCKTEEDDASVDYNLFEGDSIENPLIHVSVLKE